MEIAKLMLRPLALSLVLSLAGCAGWSSWEDSKSPTEAAVVPERPVGANDHLVRSGDTVYSIAFRNSLDYRELARWNNIGATFLIYPGQVLRLSAPPAAPKPRIQTDDIVSEGMEDIQIASPQPITAETPPPATPVVAAVPSVATGGTEPLYTSGYDWIWPTQGVVVRGYGQQGSKGLDFSGREGQPVLAAAPGRVVYSGNALKGYGELIIVKHDDTYLSAYGYNRSRLVKEGDIVTAGQPIAEMGRGPENKPVLHFEIRERGKPVNPADRLPAKTAAKSAN